MKEQYYFKNDVFTIEEYDKQKPFASFLPGIAGKQGIPLWAFYTNRGQGLASFGIRDKNGAIQEFFPANASYIYIDRIGFRTFVKKDGKVFELFSGENKLIQRKMEIAKTFFSIIETNKELNLETKVTYFGLPNESFGALVRVVECKNIGQKDFKIEIVDGLAQILPSGVDYGGYKAVSNILRSWMDVENLEHKVAFYKMRASPGDEAEVQVTKHGNFYMSFMNDSLVLPIADADLLFGMDTSLSIPKTFQKQSVAEITTQKQVCQNKIPCGFTCADLILKAGESTKIHTLIGYTHDIQEVNAKVENMSNERYIDQKFQEAIDVVEEITDEINTKTNYPLFDEYLKQNYLDNILRGGYPWVIKGKTQNLVYHLYSRKHGDLERDYNFFSLAPEYYSQGNGNFRDVCQNRRSDVLFHKDVEDHNIQVFGSLIQADGYNPLGVNGLSFKATDVEMLKNTLKEVLKEPIDQLVHLIEGVYTPGQIVKVLKESQVQDSVEELLELIMIHSTKQIEAVFGEGYWQDHWTYIYDLVETYQQIYPDKMKQLLFENQTYRYYDSPVYVYPRDEKYVKTKTGKIRQYGSILHHDEEKVERLKMTKASNWLKDQDEQVVLTNLFSKFMILAVNKFACLDPYGIGIAYEANKPGWNDAMNGLPGLFGSGVGETFELKRIVSFLRNQIMEYPDEVIELPSEFVHFIQHIRECFEIKNEFMYWDKINTGLEKYRNIIRFGVTRNLQLMADSVSDLLDFMDQKLERAIQKAKELSDGLYPTFLFYDAIRYEMIVEQGKEKIGHYGLPVVRVKEFTLKVVPAFLEGPARALKVLDHQREKSNLYQLVKDSELYDESLKFYKTSVSLDETSYELGRIRAFTKGWLERESNFLHMTYKYMYGLIYGGLYEQFYEEIKTNFVCFMEPSVYGRSPLENSSFIAPSNNPNPSLHGQGFYARLSGSTAEIISIWSYMFFGKSIFQYENKSLSFVPKPILHKSFFDKNGRVETTFLGRTKLVYHNATRCNTYDEGVAVTQITLINNQEKIVIDADRVVGEWSLKVRNNDFSVIEVHINKLGGKNLL